MKINLKTILTLAQKELYSYFNNPTGYILIVPFLLLTFFLYFKTALITNQASLRSFFDLLPMILLILAPAISMRTFSQEQKNNTLELLFAHPITELEIVLAKFLGSLYYFLALLASTLTLPLTVLIFAKPDIGVIISQYLGAIFLGASFLAIGVAASSFSKNQVSSFLIAAAVNFTLILIGFDLVLLSLPKFLLGIVTQLAILPHASNLSRGVLDFRDLLYFLTLISISIALATIKLSQRKTAENIQEKNKLNFALILIIAIGFLANIFMYTFPIRLDLTAKRIFTISKGTKETLKSLPDIVTITLYSSTNLPSQLQTEYRKAKDTLQDYSSLAKGKIKIIEKHPDEDATVKNQALQNGIQEVQFNTLAKNSFAVSSGYFGLVIAYGNEKEVMPFIQGTDDLEYQLTRRIYKLTSQIKPSLAIYTQPETLYSQEKSIAYLRQALETQYELEDIDLTEAEASISSQAVLVYGLNENIGATASAKLQSYADNGGKLILLLENFTIDPQSGSVTPLTTGLEKILNKYGITLNKELVFDTTLSENIRLGNQVMQYIIPYPLWIKSLPNTEFSPISSINYVSLAWPSSISLEPVENVNLTVVLKTSPNAGAQRDKFVINPEELIKADLTQNIGEKNLAVAATKDNSKIFVSTDTDFIFDAMLQQNPQNFDFISSLIDWAAADEIIASIKRKSGDTPIFNFKNSQTAVTIQYLNILIPPIAIIAFAFWYLAKRKKLTLRKYE